MRDLVHKQEGTFYGKRDKAGARPIPVTRVHRLTANKYSARFMETLGSADVMTAIKQHKEKHDTGADVPSEV